MPKRTSCDWWCQKCEVGVDEPVGAEDDIGAALCPTCKTTLDLEREEPQTVDGTYLTADQVYAFGKAEEADKALISDEEFAHLRARLEAKQEEVIKALTAMSSPGSEVPEGMMDVCFSLLGMVTFWMTMPTAPSVGTAHQVNAILDGFIIETGPNAIEKAKARMEQVQAAKRGEPRGQG